MLFTLYFMCLFGFGPILFRFLGIYLSRTEGFVLGIAEAGDLVQKFNRNYYC